MDRRARSRIGRPFDGDGRLRRFAPFAVVGLLALGALDLGRMDGAMLAFAAGSVAGLGAAAFLPWERLPGWLQPGLAVAYVPLVALPFYLSPPEATDLSLAFCVLLPVLWLSLHGTRRQVCTCLAVIVASFVVPRLAGVRPYAPGELATAPLWLAMVALVGVGVQRLVEQLRAAEERAAEQAQAAAARTDELERHRRDVTRLGVLLRAVPAADDAPQAICAAAVELLEASAVLLAAPSGSRWRVRAVSSRGRRATDAAYPGHGELLPAGSLPSVPLLALADGEAPWRRERLTGEQQVIREPIERGGRVIAVIEARGGIVSRREPAQRQALFELLAAEAGAALERDELLRGVAERAETDGLTGLANRRAWDRMLAGALERARGVGAPLSVALLDLDHFKHFNDVHGHLAGDRLLRAAGAGWRPLLGLGETVARWGGEEFAVLLPGRSLESAGDLLEQLRVHAPAGVTVSAGVARWDGHESARELMERADVALYQAKRTGRDRVALAGEPASAVLR